MVDRILRPVPPPELATRRFGVVPEGSQQLFGLWSLQAEFRPTPGGPAADSGNGHPLFHSARHATSVGFCF
ncbi:hypothetical protein BI364_02900 [Acidihalobacter yilgarnensis]|uniref:Uncharacterized protein n=1 Tax=Acidihalobacter yilgarnensis TaxID=2819280 RepID=A0A1D8IKT4_9GAMM|nr:hypothetical protein [Acidihalobacter yilgarnensis]AOU97090.1 hypothetical protein BI364_02900 [Acidihalobacter yilgarnensis]